MNNKPEDNDIDRLFRDSIDNMETEPSDHFWNKAYDGILQKEAKNYQMKILRWKGISYTLAAAVVALIGYNIYTGQKVSYVEQQITNIEKNQALSSESSSSGSIATNSLKNTSLANSGDQSKPVASLLHNSRNVQPLGATLSSNASDLKALTKRPNRSVATQKSFASASGIYNASANANQPSVATTISANIPTQEANTIAPSVSRAVPMNIIYLENKPNSPLRVTQSLDDAPLAQLAIISDTTTEVIPVERIAPVEPKKNYATKISLSVFYAKSAAFPILKYNGPDTKIQGDLTTSESQEAAYCFGFNVGFDISSRFTIQLGCNYRMYAFSTDFTTVNPIIGESGPYYNLVSSAGVITIPYIPGSSTNPPTSATAIGDVKYSSVCVPLKLKWSFFKNSRLKAYAVAGGSVNVIASDNAMIYCQSNTASNSEVVNVPTMAGNNSVSFSWLVGAGIEFKLARGFSVYAEPSYQTSLTPISANTPLSTYPTYLDMAVGVGYHF